MIYFIQAEISKHVKIGFTEGSAAARLTTLQTGCPERLLLLVSVPGDRSTEQWLHDKFASLRMQGEWFVPDALFFAFITGVQFAAAQGVSVSAPMSASSRDANRKKVGELLDKIDTLCRKQEKNDGFDGASLLKHLADFAIRHENVNWGDVKTSCRGEAGDSPCGLIYCAPWIKILVAFGEKHELPNDMKYFSSKGLRPENRDLRVVNVCRELVEAFEEGNRLEDLK